jgi:quercetin dioxygenase-like cupin family protein
MNYIITDNPVLIPVTGNKIIEEFIGRVSTQQDQLSVARMIAPPGWSEPGQKPEFDEVTIVLRGKLRLSIDTEEEIELLQGSTLWLKKGVHVVYSNPYSEECEYWAICFPAFSIEMANRASR